MEQRRMRAWREGEELSVDGGCGDGRAPGKLRRVDPAPAAPRPKASSPATNFPPTTSPSTRPARHVEVDLQARACGTCPAPLASGLD